MSETARVTLAGQDYVIVRRDEFERMTGLVKAAELPAPPKPDRDGNVPAVEYARASLARKVMTGRVNAGLSQRALAKLAGIRFETVCRIEKGRHTPSVPTIERIERALHRAMEAKAIDAATGRSERTATTRRTRQAKGA